MKQANEESVVDFMTRQQLVVMKSFILLETQQRDNCSHIILQGIG